MLGLLAVASIPTTVGVTESVANRDRKKDGPKNEADQLRKFTLECYCEPNSPDAKQLNGGRVILRNDKLYINPVAEAITGHPFQGFYIAYPDPDRPHPPPLGCVSTISNEPPMLNWIYVDKDTREVRFGNRTQSREHIVGPWGWEAGEEGGPGGLTLKGNEGAVAVDTSDGWEIQWEDEAGRMGVEGKRMLRVSLDRKMLEPAKDEAPAVDSGDSGKGDGTEMRTDTVVQMTDATFQHSKSGTDELSETEQVKTGKDDASRKPKFGTSSKTLERPLLNG